VFKSICPLPCSVSNLSVFTMWNIALNQEPHAVRHTESKIFSWETRLHLEVGTGTTACFCYAFRLRGLFTDELKTTSLRVRKLFKLFDWPVRTRLLRWLWWEYDSTVSFVRTAEIVPVFLSAAAPSLSEPLWDWPSAPAAHDESRLTEPENTRKMSLNN